jgi:glycosyltransferase involved in cell wall biosynthesis
VKIILITIHYPPIISSCAEQIKDLAIELKKQGHTPVVITSSPDVKFFYKDSKVNGIRIIKIKGFLIKNNYNYIIRGINELITPFVMISALFINKFSFNKVRGIIFYSPIIFFGPLIYFIKKITKAKVFLILRDHYPEDLVNIQIIKNKLIILFFKFFNKLQFNIADKIGVQSKNSKYYLEKYNIPNNKIETLYNWGSDEFNFNYNKLDSLIKNKKVLLFLGSITVAQYNKLIYKIIYYYKSSNKIIIFFVGTGSELKKINQFISIHKIKNVFIFNPIKPKFIKSLCKKCCAGLIFLNKNYVSHNIPGKFVSYIRSGLPIIADVNSESDLANFIKNYKLGIVNTKSEYDKFLIKINNLIHNNEKLREISRNCSRFFKQKFTVKTKVEQIINIFS